MRRLVLFVTLMGVALLGQGCSGGSPAAEPEVKGNVPEVQQATPDQKSPEERARMQGGGGEGS